MSRLAFLQNFTQFRNLATSSSLRVSVLSQEYRADDVWKKRLECKLLSNVRPDNYFQTILTQISNKDHLYAVDLDIFVNVAKEKLHLEETVHLLSKFRKSILAHTVLDSTHHAVCRLFLGSDRMKALLAILEDRIEYGIFPDLYMFNILLDSALKDDNFVLASRYAALIMIQEEFGLNKLTDLLSLLSLAKYIETKTDFSEWAKIGAHNDLGVILGSIAERSQTDEAEADKEDEANKGENDEEDEVEEEEEVEYIRIPFLKNPYFDNHFDLKNPRSICGKTLVYAGFNYENLKIRHKSRLLGEALQGNWDAMQNIIKKFNEDATEIDNVTLDLCKHYIENLHDVKGPDESEKQEIISALDQFAHKDTTTLATDIDNTLNECQRELEFEDIEQFKKAVPRWSEERNSALQKQIDRILRAKRLQEIKDKKEELRKREEILYYYDKNKV